jgi:hypothetical protein
MRECGERRYKTRVCPLCFKHISDKWTEPVEDGKFDRLMNEVRKNCQYCCGLGYKEDVY